MKGINNLVSSHPNLHLEDSTPWKKLEVQMYMILHYDSRIWQTILKCWAEDRVPSLESRVEVNIPESKIELHESFTLKDPRIPISFKHAVLKMLYEAESEVIKAEVQSQCESWRENGRTVHTTDEEEHLSLVCEYQK